MNPGTFLFLSCAGWGICDDGMGEASTTRLSSCVVYAVCSGLPQFSKNSFLICFSFFYYLAHALFTDGADPLCFVSLYRVVPVTVRTKGRGGESLFSLSLTSLSLSRSLFTAQCGERKKPERERTASLVHLVVHQHLVLFFSLSFLRSCLSSNNVGDTGCSAKTKSVVVLGCDLCYTVSTTFIPTVCGNRDFTSYHLQPTHYSTTAAGDVSFDPLSVAIAYAAKCASACSHHSTASCAGACCGSPRQFLPTLTQCFLSCTTWQRLSSIAVLLLFILLLFHLSTLFTARQR